MNPPQVGSRVPLAMECPIERGAECSCDHRGGRSFEWTVPLQLGGPLSGALGPAQPGRTVLAAGPLLLPSQGVGLSQRRVEPVAPPVTSDPKEQLQPLTGLKVARVKGQAALRVPTSGGP
ncbi:hypothetical protein KIL84_004249 [Mauremys mutica]|uniref:Uncharacterized protein n=1 Tax=Mauremys mutica TaxID=74926 RepID=A0A9D4AZV2_9SAUR|nr:hypothetical protein KIL84_004249 [Mauremys mutica]